MVLAMYDTQIIVTYEKGFQQAVQIHLIFILKKSIRIHRSLI